MFKKLITIAIIFLMVMMAFPAVSSAQEKPIQISLFDPIQIFPNTTAIKGLRFNFLYGKNTSVVGLDIGLVNHTTSGLSKGVQFGLVGINEGDYVGFQDNFINYQDGNFEGFQWGFVIYANYCNGFQLGFVNYARTMKGLQIGLVNIIKQGGQFPVFPIVNWSF